MTERSARPLVAGNWKMNGSLALAKEFCDNFAKPAHTDVVICPPSTLLSALGEVDAQVGAQNVSSFSAGAHTGELSAKHLIEAGCSHVIVGHSERRVGHSEDNFLVAAKANAAIQAGLVPIICVGESLEVRQDGLVYEFVTDQLNAIVEVCGVEFVGKSIIAYEPIWAIGTGKTATPEQAQDVHAFIRKQLEGWSPNDASDCRLLYGGSVNAENASALFAMPDIDGGLIGGASLKVNDFTTICQAAG